MLNAEKFKYFDSNRPEFKPYGLTVEKWTPKLMTRPDRHNEIEINLLTGGSITYLINDQKIIVPSNRLAVFWALIPHQIIHIESDAPYFVCTIPFTQFMNWRLPSPFVQHILNGEVVKTPDNISYEYDKYLMENWHNDISVGNLRQIDVSTLEIQARLNRFALNAIPARAIQHHEAEHDSASIAFVEKMIIFVARNYRQPLKIQDIGQSVGLNPDYANTLFKKAFNITLNQYVLQQRLLHAQRALSVSNESITHIAYDAGFNSLSRFNAAFKEKCGCSPRDYRKQHTYSL